MIEKQRIHMLIAEIDRISRPMTRRHPLVELRRTISFFIKNRQRARRNALIKAELIRLAETSPHLLQDIGYAGETDRSKATPLAGDDSLDEILKR